MPRSRSKKTRKKKAEMLNPDVLYEIQYTGPATGIQIGRMSFRKGITKHMTGRQVKLSVQELKRWGIAFKEVPKAQVAEMELNKAADIDNKNKTYMATRTRGGAKTVHLLGDVLRFEQGIPVNVTAKQARILKKMGFKIKKK